MTTVDNLLLTIINHPDDYAKKILSKRDFDVLSNLSISINSHFFITENQSRLLVKIFKENCEKLSEFSKEILETIESPKWSRKFRQIEQIKKLYIGNNDEQNLSIIIEFTFNSQIRKVLQSIVKTCENLIVSPNGKKYWADLTEQNIVAIFDALKPFNFDVDESIKNYYEIIKSWSKTDIENQFLITNIEHKNFHKSITDDLGTETVIDKNIIADRSMRYQYFTEIAKNPGENLTEFIANRSKSKVWVDNNQHTLSEVIKSLIELKRLPLLVVFDTVIDNKFQDFLEILSEALEENGIVDKIGIYFRLPNDDNGKGFNQLISRKSYNYQLQSDSNVAAVISGKLPKFFLKNPWKPMSVLGLNTKMGLRHGKTAVYSNCCDLIVEWADQPTMFDGTRINAWR
jgi:hypothetical protein